MVRKVVIAVNGAGEFVTVCKKGEEVTVRALMFEEMSGVEVIAFKDSTVSFGSIGKSVDNMSNHMLTWFQNHLRCIEEVIDFDYGLNSEGGTWVHIKVKCISGYVIDGGRSHAEYYEDVLTAFFPKDVYRDNIEA